MQNSQMTQSMRRYSVKEIFKTLQGEGVHAGAPAVFCRFSGCNLWSGREEDRAQAVCRFCDTDFVGMNGAQGGRYGLAALADRIEMLWGAAPKHRFVVFTGGEPLLQLDAALTAEMQRRGFFVAVETNGTVPAPAVNWLCVSPKAAATLALARGDELKLVYPQAEAPPERFAGLDFDNFILQPMDGPDRKQHTQAAIAYCLAHPQWRLGLQMHKIIGLQ